MRGSVWRLAIDEVWPEKSTGLEKRRRLKDSGRSPDTYIYREWQNPKPTRRCGARSSSPQLTRGMQGIVGRAWASFRKFITSLTLIVEPTEPQQRTDTRMRLLRIGANATWRNLISIPCTCTRTWILDKACLNTGTGRPSCQNQGMLRASRNPIWVDVMYFAEDNRALLLHCASLWMHAWMWTLRQRSRSCELSIFLKLKSMESETEKKPDPTERHVLFAGRI